MTFIVLDLGLPVAHLTVHHIIALESCPHGWVSLKEGIFVGIVSMCLHSDRSGMSGLEVEIPI